MSKGKNQLRILAAVILVGAICLSLAAGVATAQVQKTTTEAQVVGHFYEPVKLEPTNERVGMLKLPEGFRVSKFAEMSNPRMIAVNEDGTIYVTQREPGTLSMLRDTNGDGVADAQRVVAEKKNLHGLAIHNGKMYLVTINEVFVADIRPDGTLGPLKTIINNLPNAGQHPNRTLAVGPDAMLYITVGSTCNTCREAETDDDRLATILRARLDGSDLKVYASGLRNTIGFGWHPASKKMYGMDHGIDWLGDDDQHEELNEIVEGARYGWPYVYANDKIYPHNQPPQGFTKEDWARMSNEPLLLYTPHSAPMGMAFYTGPMFPADYRNDAFVAMRGSWNRKPPSGYEVVRVRFDRTGKPTALEPFLNGFLVRGSAPDGKDGQFARLAGLAVARDGALLISDDTNNTVYRVSYSGDRNRRQDMAALFPRMITSMLPETQSAPGGITVRSEAFGQDQPIPDRHSAYGQDASPALAWSGVPQGAKSLVLMMEDPDAASPKPFVHWLVANIPPTVTVLPAGLAKTDSLAQASGAMQGANHTSTLGYYGPKPPAGDPAHHYHFQIFALDRVLELPAGFNRQALLERMKGHILAKGELVGTYQRQPASSERKP